MTDTPKRFQTKITVPKLEQRPKLFEFLADSITPKLSKATWKRCIEAGGVWLKNQGQKKRLKRVTFLLNAGDTLEIFFDPNVLKTDTQSIKPQLVYQQAGISCWYKPINMLTQPSPYGDDTSLFSYVVKNIKPSFLIHRLDRETEGLVLFAHHKEMAAKLNDLFSKHLIQKKYFAFVVGKDSILEQKIDVPIEGKSSTTLLENPSLVELDFLCQKYPETNQYEGRWVRLVPTTGRKHQLRIHMQAIKRPLLFDPRYSRTHKKGMRLYLIAYELECFELNLKLSLLNIA